jgi:hypothetical protein
MAGSNGVFTYERQPGKHKLALLICLRLILAFYVSPKDVNLCIRERGLGAIRLLHEDVAAKFTDLSKGGDGSKCQYRCHGNSS